MPHPALHIIRDEHAALSSLLQSILLMIERGPGDNPERFFDVMRAMLFYIDEFPERLHHPKESDLLLSTCAPKKPSCCRLRKRCSMPATGRYWTRPFSAAATRWRAAAMTRATTVCSRAS
jgi:hemerythrin-like domain-containing protein